MGAGLPVGMAAKILKPHEKVVVIAGDGGFLMGLPDLETAVRLTLDLVVVVLTDSGYGMIKWKQASMQLASYGLDFSNPDFVLLAQSFGAQGHKINETDQFVPVLKAAIKAGGVHVIDLPIDYSENIQLEGSVLKAKIDII